MWWFFNVFVGVFDKCMLFWYVINKVKEFVMICMFLVIVSLLVFVIFFVGCGDDKKVEVFVILVVSMQFVVFVVVLVVKVDEVVVKVVIKNYVDFVEVIFVDVLSIVKDLQKVIDVFFVKFDVEILKVVKEVWFVVCIFYFQSEVFCFGNVIIDDWEGQVNVWLLDEGLIDYVVKDYQYVLGNFGVIVNIVVNIEIQVGEDKIDVKEIIGEKLVSLNELGGFEVNVVIGYYVIEFFFWGQDLNGIGFGVGNCFVIDYVQGKDCIGGYCDCCVVYLKVVIDLLVSDFEYMVGQWKVGVVDNYCVKLEVELVDIGLCKMFFGMGSLFFGELVGECMKVVLEVNFIEDEYDCFSDDIYYILFFNGKSICNIYFGEYKCIDGSVVKGLSLVDLVVKVDVVVNDILKVDLVDIEVKLQVIVDSVEKDGVYFDQMIVLDNKDGQQKICDVIVVLVKQIGVIEQVVGKLGIQDLKLDNVDYEF